MQIDDELRGVFWDLRQIGDMDEPKYRETTLQRLAAKILDGQAYEQIAFRLSHLMHCAVFAGGQNRRSQSYLEFFCDPRAGKSGWATGYFRDRLPPDGEDVHLVAAADRVLLRYPDRAAPVFVSYASMPMLAAFMEFLLNTIHFHEVRDLAAPLESPNVTYREVQDVANSLSRTLYAYLREHSSPVQEIRDFDTIGRFMLNSSRNNDQDDFDAADIRDEIVLDFWREHSVASESEFKTYRKSFRAFLRFAEMMREDELRFGFDRPVNLGSDREAGEWDPADPNSPELDMVSDGANIAGDWQGGMEDDDVVESPLEQLASSEIKFLLGSEVKLLEMADRHPIVLSSLVRSFLRDKSFGHTQSRISAALKKKQTDVSDLVYSKPETSYDDVSTAFEKVQMHLEDLIAAATYVLLNKEDDDGTVTGLDFETLTRGRKALNGLKRKGFDEIRNGDPEAIEEFRDAVPAIIALRECIAPIGTILDEGSPWSADQAADEPVFGDQFAQIYGVKP